MNTAQINDLARLAQLVATRNQTAAKITEIIGRPANLGHIGEFVASVVFDIQLEESATVKGIDGVFRSGSLNGRSVNIKWYAKLEWTLAITPNHLPDFYLVLAGPRSTSLSSRDEIRPWLILSVHLFDAAAVVASLADSGVQIGVATSVRQALWHEAGIYPSHNHRFEVSTEQRRMLALFGE